MYSKVGALPEEWCHKALWGDACPGGFIMVQGLVFIELQDQTFDSAAIWELKNLCDTNAH